MRPSVEARKQRILDVLAEHHHIKVAHLAALLGISMVTVRRDLEALDRENLVLRKHGMVSLPESTPRSSTQEAFQGTIAIIAPERHSYLNEVTTGARETLEHLGYRVVLHPTPRTSTAEEETLRRLKNTEITGILFAPRWRDKQDETEAQSLLASLTIPTVLLEREVPRGSSFKHLDSVSSDHHHGVDLALELLISLGHSRILLAARQDSPTARAVGQAFADLASTHPAIDSWNRILSSPDASPLAPEDSDAGWGDSLPSAHPTITPDYSKSDWLPQVLQHQEFTAVIVHSDENALVQTQQLVFAGIKVPSHCAVIAYDDVVAGLGPIPLTAVAPPKAEVGRVAAELLCKRIRAESPSKNSTLGSRPWTPQRIKLLPSLMARSST